MLILWFHTFALYIKFYVKYSQQINILTAEIVDFIVVRMFGVQKSCNFLSNNEFIVVSALHVISTATSTPHPPDGIKNCIHEQPLESRPFEPDSSGSHLA